MSIRIALVALLAALALPALAADAPPPPAVVRCFALQYARATDIGAMLGSAGALCDYLPDGVGPIAVLAAPNALLVGAGNAKALDDFAALVKALDQPAKQATFDVVLTEMAAKDAAVIDSEWQSANTASSVRNNNDFGAVTGGSFLTRCVKGNLHIALGSLVERGHAKILLASRLYVPNGGQATTRFAPVRPGVATPLPLEGLTITNVVTHPNDTITFTAQPGSATKPDDSIAMTVKSGVAIMLGGWPCPGPATEPRQAVLFVTATVASPAASAVMPAPLW